MILDIILFPVSLVVYAFLLHYVSQKAVKLQHALLLATAGTIVWGVLFGILNLLFVGAILYYVVALGGLLYSVLYPKTRTDYINSAYSVASCNSFGRAYRIIDTTTGAVLKEVLEDASMASCNGYPNGYPW